MGMATGLTAFKAFTSDAIEARPRIIFGGVIATMALLIMASKWDKVATAMATVTLLGAAVNAGPETINRFDPTAPKPNGDGMRLGSRSLGPSRFNVGIPEPEQQIPTTNTNGYK